MALNFKTSGISLDMDLSRWIIKEHPEDKFIFRLPGDYENILIVKEQRLNKQFLQKIKLSKKENLLYAMWEKTAGNFFKKYMVIQSEKKTGVFFEAVSNTAEWPRTIINDILKSAHSSDIRVTQSTDKKKIFIDAYSFQSQGEKRIHIDIWIKASIYKILVSDVQIIEFSDSAYLSQRIISGDLLLKNSSKVSQISGNLFRIPFENSIDDNEWFFYCYDEAVSGAIMPVQLTVRLNLFAITIWQREEYSKKIRLAEMNNLVKKPAGDNFIILIAPDSQSHHMDSVYSDQNRCYFPQQYAFDFVHHKDLLTTIKRNNSDYEGYLEKVYSVKEGIVVDLKDGIKDNKLGKTNLSDSAGNYITLKHDDNCFSFYAHLSNGSIKIRKGEHVPSGHEIALIGNSGNSTMPHLHFQMSENEHPLISRSIPLKFE